MHRANALIELGHFANVDMNDMSFLANTNFQFDPELFGGYREPQDNVLSNAFDETFFNDAFNDVDFTTPYFAPSPMPQKKDLVAEIDAAKNEDKTELVQTDDGQFLTCNKIWYVWLVARVLNFDDSDHSTGRNCSIARRSRRAILIWTVSVLIYRRRPNAPGLEPSSTRGRSRM